MKLLTDYPMYVVLATSLLIWVGIALYIQRVDARLHSLESE
jgi:hypothetical protein